MSISPAAASSAAPRVAIGVLPAALLPRLPALPTVVALVLRTRRPRLVSVVAVSALDLERTARAAQLGAHPLEEPLEGGLAGGRVDQTVAQFVSGVVAMSKGR